MSRTLLKSGGRLSRKELSEKLSRIAEGFREGEVELSSGSSSVRLEPAEEPELEIEAEKEENGEISVELEIEWMPGSEDQRVEVK